MQARGPPKKVSMLPQMPGIVLAASGTDSHLSGLYSTKRIKHQKGSKVKAYLNSLASSPQIDLFLFITRIGITIV